MTLYTYLQQLRAGGLKSCDQMSAREEDMAIALWARDNPMQAVGLMLQEASSPIRRDRIAAMLAVYFEACATDSDPAVPLRRLGGLFAGGVFPEIRTFVRAYWGNML